MKMNRDCSSQIERHLEKSPSGWFAGAEHPTAADFQMFLPMESLATGSANSGPKLQAFLSKVHERYVAFSI